MKKIFFILSTMTLSNIYCMEGDEGQCAGLNKNLRTELHLAVTNTDLEKVVDLLNKNVDINAQDINGNTPAHLAIHYCCAKVSGECTSFRILRILLNNKDININLKNNFDETLIDTVNKLEWHNRALKCSLIYQLMKKNGVLSYLSNSSVDENSSILISMQENFDKQIINKKSVQDMPKNFNVTSAIS